MKRSSGTNGFLIKMNPPRAIVLGFAVVILVGTILLSMPFASTDGGVTPFYDCLFTATSATCVTGLVVVDTGTQWSLFGQLVILLMVQIGGLGFMTVASMFRLYIKHGTSFSDREIVRQSLNLNYLGDMKKMMGYVLRITARFELVGAILLFFRFSADMHPLRAVYCAVFHSVSAFCNAGFDVMGNFRSFTDYSGDLYVNVVVTVLIITGGLGYLVWAELIDKKAVKRVSVYAKFVLLITGVLIAAGTVLFAALEWNNPGTIGNFPTWKKILASFFQSVTLRTAGFNTVDMSQINRVTVFACCLLMFIGGSSGSTAGGIKTVTAGIILLTVITVLKGKTDIVLFHRKISRNTVLRAFTIAAVGIAMIVAAIIVLSFSENSSISAIAFECVSAFGTVGVTMGVTGILSGVGRAVIIALMFMGRVGILTLSCALASKLRGEQDSVEYLEAKMLIG